MKKFCLLIIGTIFCFQFSYSQGENTKIFTIFSSYGCGCAGSGGASDTYTSHEEVLAALQKACDDIDFIEWEGNLSTAHEEVQNNKDKYDGVLIIPVEADEFYEAYRNMDIKKAEEVADTWINGARKVEASRNEIIKTARAYLAFDQLREKYDCNAVSTHLRTVSGSSDLADRFLHIY